jgi:hypothetical protein
MAMANPIPELIDLRLAGTTTEPYFTPKALVLELTQPYLLVIENPFDVSYLFYCEGFAQAIYTHFIQGTPNVSVNSITLAPHSKIQWLITPMQLGEFAFAELSTDAQYPKHRGHITIVEAQQTPLIYAKPRVDNTEKAPQSVQAPPVERPSAMHRGD